MPSRKRRAVPLAAIRSTIAGLVVTIAAMAVQSEPAFAAGPPVAISNLTFGVVCGSPQNRRICFQTNDILLTNEGTCTYAGQERRCTWYGYAFDYDLPSGKESVEIDCNWQSDVAVDVGNPSAKIANGATSMPYKFVLSRGQKHFFNPQYAVSPPDYSSGGVEHVKQSCSYSGQVLFEIEFKVHYPER